VRVRLRAPPAKEVAPNSEVVITMVPDTPDVERVLFGAAGVAEGLSPGEIVVDMSSISPLATKQFARRINELGCEYLDAPVSGGEVGAKAASLTIWSAAHRRRSRRSGRCSS
jgi:2-hydroxy-3-oxopropionate reductase